MRHDRFHGRMAGQGKSCAVSGCEAAGEFRAPGGRSAGFDGPGDYRWFCLDHIRAFNAGYDYFAGMSPEEIWKAQSPLAGWDSENRAFRPDAGIDAPPRWADFADPLDAIAQRARRHGASFRRSARSDGWVPTPDERRALETLGLAEDADRRALRSRYAELARRYHPDRNGGDRSHEARLGQVVESYQLLRKSKPFNAVS